MNKIIIAGSTGMVGSLVLKYCLDSDEVDQVISLVRRKSSEHHVKLKEVVISNFKDYTDQKALFERVKTGFFCIGVYTGQVSDE